MFFGIFFGGVTLLLILGLFFGLLGLYLSSWRYLGCLVVLEFLKVLLLGCSLLRDWGGLRVRFLSLLVMFTLEIVVALVVLVRV